MAATRRLLDAGRAQGVPIIYTTGADAEGLADAGRWLVKVPWLAHCRRFWTAAASSAPAGRR